MQAPALSNVNGQRAFGTPVGFASSGNASDSQTRLPCPFRLTQGLTKSSQGLISSFILLLFTMSSPLNIANLVMTVGVDAVKRMFRGRSTSDMSKKFFIGLKSKLDTSIVIVLSVMRRLVSTSSTGTSKRPIFRRFLSMLSLSVASPPLRGILSLQASARPSYLRDKPRSQLSHAVSAVAQTVPHSTSVRTTPCKANDQESIKSLSCQYNNFIGTLGVGIYGKIVSSHDVFSLLENVKVRVVRSCNFFRPAYYSTA